MKLLRTGLIGAGIGRSRFGAALGIMCARHGLTLDFEAIDSAERTDFDFATTVAACRHKGWTGVAVTHPFKPEAARYAGAEMQQMGACNLLTFGPPLVAANTDLTGFAEAWRAGFAGRAPGRVAIAGAGGVARAIAPALAELGVPRIDIWDMHEGLAGDLAARIGPHARAVPMHRVPQAIRAADGLVNATPLGMTGHPGSAFAPALIGGQVWAFDAVYTPVETEFLTRARATGLAILTGFDLFRCMAIDSFTALTGLTPNRVDTLAALDHLKPQEEPA